MERVENIFDLHEMCNGRVHPDEFLFVFVFVFETKYTCFEVFQEIYGLNRDYLKSHKKHRCSSKFAVH